MSSAELNAGFPRFKGVAAYNITKLYGATPALRGANLELRPGEITVLSGPNGAGKSTLLNILGTQLRPTRGRVVYAAQDGSELSRRDVRAHLGWVSHASHCYGELSGRQNVELVAELQGVDKGAYEGLADRLGLGRFAERPVTSLSRGQAQRVALARALIHGPSLLLLDEPWTGLDKKSGLLLEEVVQEERQRGAIVVIISHEAQLKERLSAREVRIVRGQIQTN